MRKYTINQAIEYAREKLKMSWDDNRQRLAFYDYVNEYFDTHSYMPLQDKLEEFKKEGYYAVEFFFGEGVGCDDMSVALLERNIVLLASPVGCVGEAKIMFKGKLKEFLTGGKKNPTIISNPPQEEEYKESGWYIWGTEEGVNIIMKRNFKLKEPK